MELRYLSVGESVTVLLRVDVCVVKNLIAGNIIQCTTFSLHSQSRNGLMIV